MNLGSIIGGALGSGYAPCIHGNYPASCQYCALANLSPVARNQGLANAAEEAAAFAAYRFANAAADPEYMARQQEAVWRDHLARVAWLRSMAIHDIRRQPFFR